MTAPGPGGPILFVNPNSDELVTAGIAAALEPFAAAHRFETIRIAHGPATISSDEDAHRGGLDLLAAARERGDARLIVSACFSDPGVDLLRAAGFPAFGLQEASLLTACARADLFGIVALSPRAIPRHRRRIAQLGLLPRMAGELPLSGASAREAGTSDAVFAETIAVGEALKARGAGAIVLGCAGFAPRRAALEEALGLPVIDPVLAAAGMALGMVLG